MEIACHRSRSRLVDDPLAVESSDFTRVPRGLLLALIEIRWDGDYCLGYLSLKSVLRYLLHRVQEFCGDLFR